MNNLVCRMGTIADIPALKALYHLGFPEDDSDFIDRFFSMIQPETMACCGLLDGKIVCGLYLLPAKAVCGSNTVSVRYLYAGATHPYYRGRGHYSTLLQFAAEQGRAAGESAIYLRPASANLFDYYERLGYQPGMAVGEPVTAGFHFEPDTPFRELFAEDVNATDSTDRGCVILPLSGTLPPYWWHKSTTLLIGE